jgi:DNA-binding CsgD family transcriptional regulator
MPTCPRCGSRVRTLRDHTRPLLSPREREVLALLLDDRTVGEIMAALCITKTNVNSTIHHMLRKTGLHTRSDLLTWARRETGLGAPPEP